jgi:glutathione S-transferase
VITVHHLDESRSQRILWLLEELDVPYEIAWHWRDGQTRLAPPTFMPRIEAEIVNHLGYIDTALCARDYLLGMQMTGADVQLSFVGELAAARLDCSAYPNMIAWVRRFQARPAYQAALEKGGPYAFAF